VSARKPTRIYCTVAVLVDSDWYDGLNADRPQDIVAQHVYEALGDDFLLPSRMAVVHVEASEVL